MSSAISEPVSLQPRPARPMIAALSRDALEMMAVILRERPATIGTLANLIGRAGPNVRRSLKVLTELGLVRMVRVGATIRPEPIVGGVTVDLVNSTFQPVPLKEANRIEHPLPA